MKKKLLALTLSASMVMSMAACGGEASQEDGTATPAPTKASTEGTATPEPTKAADGEDTPEPTKESTPEPTQEPSYDFGGRTFRIGSYYDMTPNPDGNVFEKAYSERIKYVEENYNCKIEFVNVGDYMSAYVTSVLAGDPCCDAGYMISWRMLPALIEGGIVYPISDLGVVDFDKPWYLKSATEACTYTRKAVCDGHDQRGCAVWYFLEQDAVPAV